MRVSILVLVANKRNPILLYQKKIWCPTHSLIEYEPKLKLGTVG